MKNLLKKTLAAALAAMIVLGAPPLAGLADISLPSFDIFASAAEEEPVWTVATDDMLVIDGNTIKGYTDKLEGNIELPIKTANGTAITKIANGAFKDCSGLTAILIPESIESIGYNAFDDCENLESIRFESNVCSEIGSNESSTIFNENSGLTTITFAENVKKVPAKLCRNATKLNKVIFEGTVTEIGYRAFENCTSLKAIDLSAITVIGYGAFRDSGLTSVEFCENLKSIGSGAFTNCDGIKTLTITPNVESIGYNAFDDCENLESIRFESNVCSEIGANESSTIFNENSGLTTITFAENVKKVPAKLCRNATKLNKVIFEGTVTEIGYRAFENCTSLEEIHLAAYSKETFDFDKLTIGSNNDVVTEDIFTFGVESKTETNEEFDVTVSYISTAFDTEVKLSITETEGERENGSIDISDRENYEQISCFNIKMILADGSSTAAVQPNGKVTIKMAIPEKYIGRTNFKIVHRFSNGGRENFSTNPVGNDKKLYISSDGKYCIFEVESFSEFELLASAPTVSIKNKNTKNTINYGETLCLTANTTNMPADAQLFWYVDGVYGGDGTTFDLSFEKGGATVSVKLVDADGNDYYGDVEISDSQTVTVKAGFFQKLINFFKTLFGLNKTVTQAFGFYY